MADKKLPQLVQGARYGPETMRNYTSGSRAKIKYDPDFKPQYYQPKSQAEYDAWVKKGKEQDLAIDTNRNSEPPGRAKGGPVQKGKKYIVGEKGPETFVPKQTGKIVPAPVKRQPGGMGRPKVVSKGVTKMPFKKK